MSRRLMIAAGAALALASAAPALAQDAPAPAPAPAPANPEDAAFQATAEAFGARMQSMSAELQATVGAAIQAGGDEASAIAAADGVLVNYTGDINAFADALSTYLTALAARPENAANSATILQARDTQVAEVRNIPETVRGQVREAVAAAAAAPAEAPAAN